MLHNGGMLPPSGCNECTLSFLPLDLNVKTAHVKIYLPVGMINIPYPVLKGYCSHRVIPYG